MNAKLEVGQQYPNREIVSQPTYESLIPTERAEKPISAEVLIQWKNLIQQLAETVEKNVETIIQQIDNGSSMQQKIDTNVDPNQADKKAKNSLAARWSVAYQSEIQKYHKRRTKGEKKRFQKMTIDEEWDAALGFISSQVESSKVAMKAVSFSSEHGVSPLFGLPIDKNGHLLMNGKPVDDSDYYKFGDALHMLAAIPKSQPTILNATDIEMATTSPLVNEIGNDDHVFDTIYKAVALLSSMTPQGWKQFDRLPPHGDNAPDELSHIRELLYHSQESRYTLSSSECNLLLAQLLTSPTLADEVILEKTLQIFQEMTNLSSVDEGGADSLTYRLLFLGLPRRLSAASEAASLCKIMTKTNASVTSETFLEAMKVCQSCDDIGVARELVRHAMDPSTPVRPTARSFHVWMDMLKSRNMLDDALQSYQSILEVRWSIQLD